MPAETHDAGFTRWHACALFLLALALLLPQVWSETGLTGQDEYWLSLRTPMESLARDSWLTPYVNEAPRLRKPPLFYWAIMLTYRLFGIQLWAARIWGVLAGAGLVTLTGLLYRRLFQGSGFLAGLLCLATLSVAVESRRAMLDLPVACLAVLGVYGAFMWARTWRCRWLVLAALALSAAFLTKGPLGVLAFCAGVLSGLVFAGRWRAVWDQRRAAIWALALCLALCLPWPLWMAHLWPEFGPTLREEAAARQLGWHWGAPLSGLGKTLAALFPWSLLFLAGAWQALRARQAPGRRRDLWLLAWMATTLLPCLWINLYSRYLLPLVPAGCILSARWLETGSARSQETLLRLSLLLLAVPAILAALFMLWFRLGQAPALAVLVVAGGLLYQAWRPAGHPTRLIAGAAVLLALLLGGLYPALGLNALPAGIERQVGSRAAGAYNSSQPAMLSMRLQRSVRSVNDAVLTAEARSFDGFVFVRAEDVPLFEALMTRLTFTWRPAGAFKTLYARQTWLRFARADATPADWRRAFQARSLEPVMSTIVYYRLAPRDGVAHG